MSNRLNAPAGPGRRAAATIASELELRAVQRIYFERAAIDNISLSISAGEVVSLLGQSGCGKTTLLRIAAGVDRPTSGTVVIDGRTVASDRVFVPPERRGVGLVFQDHALFPHLTILRNVMFGLTALGRREAREEALTALGRVGLPHHGDRYPHELSGGEQQRVALARAIVPRPGILLLDEPFSGLDARLREEVRAETLAVLRETGATAIIVSHDPEEALRMSDRIVLMQEGRIVQEGDAGSIYRKPQSLFVARFFSPLNEFSGRVQGGMLETPVGAIPAAGFADGTRLVAAIRPQALALASPQAGKVGTPGRIVSHRFLGEVDLFEVAVANHDAYVISRRPAGEDLRNGADVTVAFDPDDVLVFSESI